MFDAQLIDRIGWTLLHSVWQLALIACLAGLCSRALFRRSPNAKYAIGCIALLAMIVTPLVTFSVLPSNRNAPDAAIAIASDAPVGVHVADNDPVRPTLTENDLGPAPTDGLPAGSVETTDMNTGIVLDAPIQRPTAEAAPVTENRDDRRQRLVSMVQPLMPTLVMLWLVGVGLLALRPLFGLYTVRRIRRVGRSNASDEIVSMVRSLCQRMAISRTIAVAHSTLLDVPAVVGTLSPLLLLPLTAVTGLSPQQLEALIAHELAHVRRYDFLVNFVQSIVESVFFYHPAVWWVSYRMREEREHCCDDIALGVCGDRTVYVKALVAMDGLRSSAPYPAVAANGGALLKRIRRIAGADRVESRGPWLGGVVLLVMAVACLAALFLRQDDALADEDPNQPPADLSGTKAKATIKLEDRTYLVGENVHLQFGITNTQDEPIEIKTGGDYRGGPRALRFKVVAFDADGKRVADPYKDHPMRRMGGFSREFTIAPGKTEWLFVPLARYCEFSKPGTYTLRVYHDLGWGGDHWDKLKSNELPTGKHNAPIGEGTITFAAPTDEQAKQVVERMAKFQREHPTESNYGPDGVDFTTLRLPVYFPLLKRLTLDADEAVALATSRALKEFQNQGRVERLPLSAVEAERLFKQLKPAWSGERLGVQFGISHAGEERQFRIGTRVPLVAFARNVSDKPLDVMLYADFFWFAPTVVDRQNDAIKLEKFYINGILHDAAHNYRLQPGEAFAVRHPGIGLGEPKKRHGSGSTEKDFPYWKEPIARSYILTQTHQLTVAKVDETKPATDPGSSTRERARFTSRAIEFDVLPAVPPRHDPATGRLQGGVFVQPPFPQLRPRKLPPPKVKSDPADGATAIEINDESLVIAADGGLANALVYLREPPAGWKPTPPPEEPAVLEFKGHSLHPRVSLVRVGQDMIWKNSLTTMETLRSEPLRSSGQNRAMPPDTLIRLKAVYDDAELLPHRIRSDIHIWKKTYVLALDHPFAAVTDAEGRFAITGLPPGEYSFRVWHERVGYIKKDLSVRIRAGKAVGVSINCSGDSFVDELNTSDAGRPGANERIKAEFFTAIYAGDRKTVSRLVENVDVERVPKANLLQHVLGSPNWVIVEALRYQLKLDISPVQLAVIRGRIKDIEEELQKLDGDEKVARLGGVPSLLHLAALHGHSDVIKQLVRHGADIHKNGHHFMSTPLASAAERGHVDAVKTLIEVGVDVNQVADYTALMRACIGKQPSTTKVLLEHGAKPNAARHDKQRAIHLAAKRTCVECVKLLLKHGADPIAVPDGREAAQYFAQRFKHEELAAILTKAATDQRPKDPKESDQAGTADSGIDQKSPEYQQGYDPLKTQRNQVGTLPDDAWGEVVNGVQAAISAPDKLRMNDVVTVYLVLRNVSAKTLRLTLPQYPDILSFRPDGTTISYSVNKPAGHVERLVSWELKPGHQTNIPSPPIQVLASGDLGLNRALTALKPGPHTLYARTGAGGERWATDAAGKRRKFVPAEGEWTGWLSPARRPVEVLAEKAPFTVTSLKDLPASHGLKYVFGTPPSLNNSATEWIALRDGLTFALDSSQDAHWLRDHGTYNRLVFWGPIPAAKLSDLKLLDRIRQLSDEYIQTASHQHQANHRVAVLVRGAQPLADMGLDFVPTMNRPQVQGRIPSDYLVRTIRDRRVELQNMGLAIPMQRALDILTADDAPMPDDSQFKVVTSTEFPPGLKEKSWGPTNDGLQAAALMPDSISAKATEKVRLFIRNVSDHDVRLAVSERAGYDYATAVDADGHQLQTIRPQVYPSAFASVIMPEVNPGQSTQNPPTATLQKFLLKPGAVLELSTKTSLSFNAIESGTGSFGGFTRDDTKPAVTHITGKPTTARVSWHLHTANGAIYSKDLKRRLWPAKGSWSGLLKTAPVEVRLSP